jgi:hypothetical protein
LREGTIPRYGDLTHQTKGASVFIQITPGMIPTTAGFVGVHTA